MPLNRRWTRTATMALTAVLVPSFSPRALAENDPAVRAGVQFLRGRAGSSGVGESALIALALLKSDLPPNDPDVARCINTIRSRFASGGFDPERKGGSDIYEAGVVSLALANLDAEARRAELAAVARYLISKQKANGSWDYDSRTAGDTSISQYAILGLWEAENGGAEVGPEVWDRAASWFLSTQASGGSWCYHRDEGSPETLSMTAAGVGSLLICRRQLARSRRGIESLSNLLTPVGPEARRSNYDIKTSSARIDQAVKAGLAWLGSNFTTRSSEVIGPTVYYTLYGVERIGALADRDTLGRVNWFEAGRDFIHRSQRPDGAWDSTHGDIPNTAWAILFITKSTAKTIRRIEVKQLGAGTLLGGRYLPKDLSNLTVAGGRVVSRPMNGAVEGMLAVLEDPRAENADGALSGLVARYRSEGAQALRPYKDRFRKLLTDRDPGLRRVGAWTLARTGEMEVVPSLIAALEDPDDEVVGVARDGLCLLSRKLSGFGPKSPSTPEERREAAAKWRAWYETVRPLGLEGQRDDPLEATPLRSPP
jgi:hypothetical protein